MHQGRGIVDRDGDVASEKGGQRKRSVFRDINRHAAVVLEGRVFGTPPKRQPWNVTQNGIGQLCGDVGGLQWHADAWGGVEESEGWEVGCKAVWLGVGGWAEYRSGGHKCA